MPADRRATARQYAYFRVTASDGPEKIVVFDTQEISIGRSKDSDLRSESAEMSRRHAKLCRSKQGCSVQNYSTSNATMVNGAPIKTHLLCDGDVVTVADLQLTFCLRAENPASLGEKVGYASELKGFAPQVAQGDGEATVLGMLDAGASDDDDDDEFVIRPAGDFEPGMRGTEGLNQPRDLDLELEGFGLDEIELPEAILEVDADPPTAAAQPVAVPAAAPAAAAQPAAAPSRSPEPVVDELLLEDEAWTLDDPKETPQPRPAGVVSLTLELEGLTPELQDTVRGLFGKLIELPKLRIRVKDEDLG